RFEEAKPFLTGDLGNLSKYNGLSIPIEYFDNAMERLQNNFLKSPIYVMETAASPADQAIVQAELQEADEQPSIDDNALTAEAYFIEATQLDETDYEGQIASYSKAIELKPDYVDAYNNRGTVYTDQGNLEAALQDFDQ